MTIENWKLEALRELSDLQQMLLFPEDKAVQMQQLSYSEANSQRIPLWEEVAIRLEALSCRISDSEGL